MMVFTPVTRARIARRLPNTASKIQDACAGKPGGGFFYTFL